MMFAPSPLVSIFPIVLMLLLGGGGGLPLGVPPLPEDPVLARVAPEECLVYASCSGMATPDAKSKNQTEQLLAEPEVQRLWSEIERVMVAKIGEGAPQQQAAVARDAIRWGKWLLTRPVAAFVSSVGHQQPRPGRPRRTDRQRGRRRGGTEGRDGEVPGPSARRRGESRDRAACPATA